MERNPNYWRGPAKIAKIEARDVPSPATQKLQVENGDVDVALNVTPDLTASMRNNKNVKILLGQSLDNMYMGLTTDPALHPALAKKEVRQAIRHAVDRTASSSSPTAGPSSGRRSSPSGCWAWRPRPTPTSSTPSST